MNGALVLKDPLAQRFIEVKEQIIADSVCEIAEYFRCRGLIVGLDLFAPVVSRLVGQNYALITRNADFIKPMLYRRTEAPAGVGYELSLLKGLCRMLSERFVWIRTPRFSIHSWMPLKICRVKNTPASKSITIKKS